MRRIKNIEVAGKTGSITGGVPYGKRDWFVSFAKRKGQEEDSGISVCIMIVNVKKWYVKSTFLAKKIIDEVDVQLRTRIPFVPSPDKITYQLFKELALFTGSEFSTSLAYGYTHMAIYYANDDNQIQEAEKLLNHFRKETLENYFEDYDAEKLGDLERYIDTTDFADGVSGVNWYKSGACCYDNQGYDEVETHHYHKATKDSKIPTPLKWVIFIFMFIIFGVWLMIKQTAED